MKRRSTGLTITRVTKLWVRRENNIIGISEFAVDAGPKAELVMSLTSNSLVEGHHQERVDVYTAPGVTFDRAIYNKVLDYIKRMED